MTVGNNFAVTGNLTVNGTTTTVNSTTTTVDGPVFTLGGDSVQALTITKTEVLSLDITMVQQLKLVSSVSMTQQ